MHTQAHTHAHTHTHLKYILVNAYIKIQILELKRIPLLSKQYSLERLEAETTLAIIGLLKMTIKSETRVQHKYMK